MYTHRKGGRGRYTQVYTKKGGSRYTYKKEGRIGTGTHIERGQAGSLGIHTPRGQVQLTQGVSTQCTPGQPSALDDPEKYHHRSTESFPPSTPNTAIGCTNMKFHFNDQ